MDVLSLISVVVGILAGVVALLEKFFHILPRNRGPRRVFEREFCDWKETACSHIASHDNLRRFAGYVLQNRLDDERKTFALLSAIQHGDKLLHDLIDLNKKNVFAVPFVFDYVSGRGIRVGWRAEYVLTRLDRDALKAYVEKLPEASKESENLAAPIQRILHGTLKDFLTKQLRSEDQKLKSYATEVLSQIQSGVAPRPSLRA